MKSKHIIFIIVLAIITAIVLFVVNKSVEAPINSIGTGKAIYYSGINAKNLIKIDSPKPGDQQITSPLVVTGEARGNWYFEATFPISLTNWDGLIIAEGYATAKGDWMTEEFVPFEATIEFIKPECPIGEEYCKRGSLILQKDNPSGLPEHDAAVEMTVWFE